MFHNVEQGSHLPPADDGFRVGFRWEAPRTREEDVRRLDVPVKDVLVVQVPRRANPPSQPSAAGSGEEGFRSRRWEFKTERLKRSPIPYVSNGFVGAESRNGVGLDT